MTRLHLQFLLLTVNSSRNAYATSSPHRQDCFRAMTLHLRHYETGVPLLVTPDMDTAVELSNNVAPEHLEVLVEDPWTLLPAIRNAGAIFMGANSPEPVGDYFAGPNHVLPTNGTARFSSALSVETFTKKSSIIAASAAFTQKNAPKIARLARLEGLEAHARSAETRLPK